MLLVSFSSFFFPLLFAFDHYRNAINDLPIRCVWIWNRLWNIAHFVITVMLVIRMSDSHQENCYWEIAFARNLIESFAAAKIIDELCHASIRLITIIITIPITILKSQLLPKYVLVCLYVAALVQWYSFEFAVVIAAFVGLWLVAMIIYVVARKMGIVQNENDVSSQLLDRYRIEALPWWDPVAIVRPSNKCYFGNEFFPVITESSDGSSILVLEMWWSNYEVFLTVWRVSTLNGRQKKVHEFRLTELHAQLQLHFYQVQGFESHGLIIVVITVPPFGSWLFIFDQRLREAAVFCYDDFWNAFHDGSCIKRHVDSNGQLRGWRVRLVGYQPNLCDCHDTDHYRPTIVVTTFDLLAGQINASFVRQEELVTGPCLVVNEESDEETKQIRCFRTGRGVSGFFCVMPDGSFGRLFFFNRFDSTFGTLNNIFELCQIDRSFALYFNTPAPGNRFVVESVPNLMPAVLSEEECIEVTNNGVIYRSALRVSSLRRLALVAVFRQWPELPDQMSAIEFRAETGIGDLENDFGS